MAKFEQVLIGNKQYPAAITNYSLAIGEKLNLIPGTQLTDLINSNGFLKVIYLSVVGIDRTLDLTYEKFLENYMVSEKILIKNYNNLISNCTDVKPNKFAEGLALSTSNKVDKDKKKIKPPKLQFECVEDRYVWYCLIYGIDSDIFWYHPIPDVERIYRSVDAYKGWQNNPK